MALRVAVVTQDDPFYVPRFFETFFAEIDALDAEIDICDLGLLRSFDESFLNLVCRMYRLYGPVDFLRRGLGFVYRTVADAAGVGQYSVGAVADDWGVSTRAYDSVNTESYRSFLREEGVDVVLSVSAPEIFEADLLNTPKWGCLNVHTAALPKYRGMMPTFWALYHGDDEVGITVHTMAEEIDAGKAVNRTSFAVEPGATLDDVILQGKREGGRLAAQSLSEIATGEVECRPIEGEGSYFSFPTVEERKQFQRRGNRLL